jgi:ribulose-phosphate 3-epimerase
MLTHSALSMESRFDRAELINRLRGVSPAVFASLLMCDFRELGREVAVVEAAGAAAMLLDVMDGQFVPIVTYGMPIVEAVRRSTELPIDVHLMIDHPEKYIEQFRLAGADSMTVHAGAVGAPRTVLKKIRALGACAGLAINPSTPLSAIEASLPFCDLILVMSVMPGFGGQKFDDGALEKLRTLKTRSDVNALLEVDGGVSKTTIGKCAEAGAELFVVGSAIFRQKNYASAVEELRTAATT